MGDEDIQLASVDKASTGVLGHADLHIAKNVAHQNLQDCLVRVCYLFLPLWPRPFDDSFVLIELFVYFVVISYVCFVYFRK